MRRRDFLGVAVAATASVSAAAQGVAGRRRIGLLLDSNADDRESKARIEAFWTALEELGWRVGSNVEPVYRWGSATTDSSRKNMAELAGTKPDVILAAGTPALTAAQQAGGPTPVVFVNVADPVAAGLIEDLAEPGGNVTGFTVFESGMSLKWLELLKELAPGTSRVAVLRDAGVAIGVAQFAAIQALAGTLGMTSVTPIDLRDATQIEKRLERFASRGGGGMIVTASTLTGRFRDLLTASAARYGLPAVYPYPHFAQAGGLVAYGPDLIEPFRQAAAYVHRILNGESPAKLPVQSPTKYLLSLNRKAAFAAGIQIPGSLLARADEVIE
jgi:putative tryptophan/tyrosine transport system substrate-binding protein